MRKALSASVLVLALACSAFAGEIPNGVTQPPPPPQTVETQEPTAENETSDGELESLTETVLSVLKSVLALL